MWYVPVVAIYHTKRLCNIKTNVAEALFHKNFRASQVEKTNILRKGAVMQYWPTHLQMSAVSV